MTQPPKPVEVTHLTITGNRLKRILKQQKLSQEECARRIDISARHLNRILHGSVPALEIAFKLQIVLNTSIQDLFIISKKTRRAL